MLCHEAYLYEKGSWKIHHPENQPTMALVCTFTMDGLSSYKLEKVGLPPSLSIIPLSDPNSHSSATLNSHFRKMFYLIFIPIQIQNLQVYFQVRKFWF